VTTSEPRPTPGFLLWRLTMKWRAAVDRAVAPLGLTHAQYSVLASLYGMVRAGQRPSQRALADHTGLEPVYISKLARTLERAGLVQRLGNPTDTRAVQLALTPHGIDIVQQAIKIVLDLQEQLTAPLGGTGSERTRALMDDLQTLLSATPLETRGDL
jgi:MarR family transcriptional regulator, organic hydroperoxide resistance regulator